MPTTPKPSVWEQYFWQLARVLQCLPSTFPEENEHVFQKARDLVAARAPRPEEVCPWPDYYGQQIVHGARMWHPVSGQTFTAIRMRGVSNPGDAWLAVYDQSEAGVPSRLCLQIGDKGQAVLIEPAAKTGGA